MSGNTLTQRYQRDGFVFPLRALSEAEAARWRSEYETLERDRRDDPNFLYAINGGMNFVLPLLDNVCANSRILDAVEQILGPDIVVFSASIFAKEAGSTKYVGWHQDLTYWGLTGAEEVTAWLAISPASVESGCMRMIAGSHRQALVAHRDTFHGDSLLTRGQELAERVDESKAHDVVLQPGEFSLHHGHTFHGSHANRSNDRRIGLSINYVSTAMASSYGVKPVVRLVRGEDRHGNFELAPPPQGCFLEAGLAWLHKAKKVSESYYYAGTERRLATDAVGARGVGSPPN